MGPEVCNRTFLEKITTESLFFAVHCFRCRCSCFVLFCFVNFQSHGLAYWGDCQTLMTAYETNGLYSTTFTNIVILKVGWDWMKIVVGVVFWKFQPRMVMWTKISKCHKYFKFSKSPRNVTACNPPPPPNYYTFDQKVWMKFGISNLSKILTYQTFSEVHQVTTNWMQRIWHQRCPNMQSLGLWAHIFNCFILHSLVSRDNVHFIKICHWVPC